MGIRSHKNGIPSLQRPSKVTVIECRKVTTPRGRGWASFSFHEFRKEVDVMGDETVNILGTRKAVGEGA